MIKIGKAMRTLGFFLMPGLLLVAALTEAFAIGLIASWYDGASPWWVLLLVALAIGSLFGVLAWRCSAMVLPPAMDAVSGPLQRWALCGQRCFRSGQ